MIDPTQDDIGRRVRMWIPAERRAVLGTLVGFTSSHCLVVDDGETTPRHTIRQILTWVKP